MRDSASMRPRPCGPGYTSCARLHAAGGCGFNEAQAMRPGIRAGSGRGERASSLLQ